MQKDLSSDPEALSNLYLDITDDLGYAQTHYHRRSIRIYLNQLAQRIFIGVNKYQRTSLRKTLDFWLVELPLEIYRAKNYMLFALLSFLVYVLLGWISSSIYPDFIASVLGQGYVDMTMENIAKGNPLGVYEESNPFSMFIKITGNNLMVSILTFFAGILFTLGTQFFLFGNGIMLGSFQQMFYKKGLLITSFLGIWIHGAFEISSIALSAGAGITAGAGWLFPGSFSRVQAFKSSFSRGAKIMLSILPLIVLAGFFESYVTRNYNTLPDASKWTIILGSFVIVGFLYLFLPIYQARKYPERLFQETDFKQPHPESIELLQVRNAWQNYRQGIMLFFQIIGKIMPPIFYVAFPIGLGFILLRAYLFPEDLNFVYWFDWSSHLSFIMGYAFSTPIDIIGVLIWPALITFLLLKILHPLQLSAELIKDNWKIYLKSRFLKTYGFVLLLLIPVFYLPWYILLGVLALFPLFLFLPLAVSEAKPLKMGFRKGFSYARKSFFGMLITMVFVLLTIAIVCQPLSSVLSIQDEVPDLLDLLVQMMTAFMDKAALNSLFWSNLFREVVYLIMLLFSLTFALLVLILAYYSTVEKIEAVNLKKESHFFGERSRLKETKASNS